MTVQVDVFIVEEAKDVEPCLHALQASMKDKVVAIDMEWKTENKFRSNSPTGNKVAMIQLASSSVVVLIRTCKLGGGLPEPIIEFCRCGLLLFLAGQVP